MSFFFEHNTTSLSLSQRDSDQLILLSKSPDHGRGLYLSSFNTVPTTGHTGIVKHDRRLWSSQGSDDNIWSV